jgi:hypothetical protein
VACMPSSIRSFHLGFLCLLRHPCRLITAASSPSYCGKHRRLIGIAASLPTCCGINANSTYIVLYCSLVSSSCIILLRWAVATSMST